MDGGEGEGQTANIAEGMKNEEVQLEVWAQMAPRTSS